VISRVESILIDLVSRTAIQIQNFESESGRLDKNIYQSAHAHIFDLTVGCLD